MIRENWKKVIMNSRKRSKVDYTGLTTKLNNSIEPKRKEVKWENKLFRSYWS